MKVSRLSTAITSEDRPNAVREEASLVGQRLRIWYTERGVSSPSSRAYRRWSVAGMSTRSSIILYNMVTWDLASRSSSCSQPILFSMDVTLLVRPSTPIWVELAVRKHVS